MSCRIVLTGGPGAGKTAILELARRALCPHVHVLPEAAGIVFEGGFPRGSSPALRRAAQRAIFYVQRELESTVDDDAITLCDRGTLDAVAYWPELLAAVGTTADEQLARYAAVIHLRTPSDGHGYDHRNPIRIESAAEAAAIDARIAAIWSRHPRYVEVPATPDFLAKATRAIALIRAELPEVCCEVHEASGEAPTTRRRHPWAQTVASAELGCGE